MQHWLRNLNERERLLDDPGGARSWLEDQGLTLNLVYTAEGFWNARGGITTHDARKYRGGEDFFVEFDTGRAGLWPGGAAFFHLQEVHGEGITEKYVGDFQVLSNLDTDHYVFQISEIWYLQEFLDGALSIKLGKQEANEDFAYVENGGEFIHSSPGYSPTIPLASYPDQDWGAVVGLAPASWATVHFGVYQGRPNGSQSIGNTLDNLYGPMLLLEPALHYTVWSRHGHLRPGVWFNGDRFDELDDGVVKPGRKRESYGFYLTWDQVLLQENPDEPEDEQGLGVFGQYGWAPEDRSEAAQYVGAGLQWVGPIPTRDLDIVGLGAFHVIFSDEGDFADDYETAIELFYKLQLVDWLSLKPDLQYIIHPGGIGNPNSLVLGARTQVSF